MIESTSGWKASPVGWRLSEPTKKLLLAGGRTDSLETLLSLAATALEEEGVPVLRMVQFMPTLHPQIRAMGQVWLRGGPSAERVLLHGLELATFERSPFARIMDGAPRVRRRLDGARTRNDFPILRDMREIGGTDYLALPVPLSRDRRAALSIVTDRPGGFTARDLRMIGYVVPALGISLDLWDGRRTASVLLETYLGASTGARVLSGQIQRGDGERIFAVIWYSDLRQSTALADRLPHNAFFGLLNDYFDCAAGAVLDHGGEVLRFIGDAVLAIFPIVDGETSIRDACRRATEAAREASLRVAACNAARREAGQDVFSFGIGLHLGDVMYGNIGVQRRLEFSVIGRAVNEVARIEDMSKHLGREIIASARFAGEVEAEWIPLGNHELRGVGRRLELMALATGVPVGEERVA